MTTIPDHLRRQPESGVMTDAQVAERLGTSRSQLRRLRLRGGGPRFVRVGRRVMYRTASVLDFEARAERASTSDQASAG